MKAKPRQKIGGTNWLINTLLCRYAGEQRKWIIWLGLAKLLQVVELTSVRALFNWIEFKNPMLQPLADYLFWAGNPTFTTKKYRKGVIYFIYFRGYFRNFGGLLVVFIKFVWDVFFSIFTRRCRVSENSSWSSSFGGVQLFLNFSHILLTFWLIGGFYAGFVF